MPVVQTEDVRKWLSDAPNYSTLMRSIGSKKVDPEYFERLLGMPLHLRLVLDKLQDEQIEIPREALDSIPFYSLCRGLFMPLSGLSVERAAQWFGLAIDPPPDAAGREALLHTFLEKPTGLSLLQKLACVLGDPFFGRPGKLRRDSLLRLLTSIHMVKRSELLDKLTRVGDPAALFADARPSLRGSPPLTAVEVLETLRFLPDLGKTEQFHILRSLLNRCGKIEAFFLIKLILPKVGFGFEHQTPLLVRVLAEHFKVDEASLSHAVALTDLLHCARVLRDDGIEGLQKIQLQPLVPVRPTLAGGNAEHLAQTKFPLWVERKYDGIRLMLHKSTAAGGSVLCGAYTRNRNEWLELIPGLDGTIKMLPCHSVIVDGELYGTVLDFETVRPATVYEVHASLQGEGIRPVQLKFAAFDLIYQDGVDLTRLPLAERRRRLWMLLAPMASFPTLVPLAISEGQPAENKEDLNRLYHHFRAQGYEGIIAKDLQGPYLLGVRDPSWMKRKPEVTLDLVLLGAVLAVTTKEKAGRFGSYVIGARQGDGSFVDVGDVAGVDQFRDSELQADIMRQGLLTGARIERPSASGVRPGFELRPGIVVTVRFEGITKDGPTGRLSLRDPKLVSIRSDKSAGEADLVTAIDELYLRQRVG